VQDDLASLAALTDAGEGRSRLLERVARIDRRFQHASVGARSKLDELSVVRIDYEIRDARCLFGDGNEARGGPDRPIEDFATDGVEDEVARFVRGGESVTSELHGDVTHAAVGAEHADTLVFA
jgi:hypothetical protein